jgi:hypothetical protein
LIQDECTLYMRSHTTRVRHERYSSAPSRTGCSTPDDFKRARTIAAFASTRPPSMSQAPVRIYVPELVGDGRVHGCGCCKQSLAMRLGLHARPLGCYPTNNRRGEAAPKLTSKHILRACAREAGELHARHGQLRLSIARSARARAHVDWNVEDDPWAVFLAR